jgi:hypothetical protein
VAGLLYDPKPSALSAPMVFKDAVFGNKNQIIGLSADNDGV